MDITVKEIKVVLLGASGTFFSLRLTLLGVGKSSLLTRYVLREFRETMETTIGPGFKSKTIQYKNETYRFQVSELSNS